MPPIIAFITLLTLEFKLLKYRDCLMSLTECQLTGVYWFITSISFTYIYTYNQNHLVASIKTKTHMKHQIMIQCKNKGIIINFINFNEIWNIWHLLTFGYPPNKFLLSLLYFKDNPKTNIILFMELDKDFFKQDTKTIIHKRENNF